MSTDWTAAENALRAWVKGASGLDDGHVIWEHPNAKRPEGLYIGLELLEDSPAEAFPELLVLDAAAPTAGAELEIRAVSRMGVGFRMQCFAPPARGTRPGVPYGTSSAAALLRRVRTSISLPSVVDALEAAGVSIYEPGSVQSVPAVEGTDFEGRAVLEVRCYVGETASEFTTFIETIGISAATEAVNGTELVETYDVDGSDV